MRQLKVIKEVNIKLLEERVCLFMKEHKGNILATSYKLETYPTHTHYIAFIEYEDFATNLSRNTSAKKEE